MIDRQAPEHWQALVLKRTEADRLPPIRRLFMLRRQRMHQILPVRRNAGRAVRPDEIEITGLVRIVGNGQHSAGGVQQADAGAAIGPRAVRLPGRGIHAAKPEQRLLRLVQRQIVAKKLGGDNGEINVVEKIQRSANDREIHWRALRLKLRPHRGHVPAPEDAHRRGAIGRASARLVAFAIQKSLHRWHESGELGVVALLETAPVASKGIGGLLPLARQPRQAFGMPHAGVGPGQRRQLHRPQQYLPELPHHRPLLVHETPRPS